MDIGIPENDNFSCANLGESETILEESEPIRDFAKSQEQKKIYV